MPFIGHRGPGFLGRQRIALLQQFDGLAIRGAHEGHVAIARRPVDGDAGLQQPLAGRVDVVDLIGEMAEMARLAVILRVPIVGKFEQRLGAAGFLDCSTSASSSGATRNTSVNGLSRSSRRRLFQPELVAIEVERGIEIAHAQHGVEIAHVSYIPETKVN